MGRVVLVCSCVLLFMGGVLFQQDLSDQLPKKVAVDDTAEFQPLIQGVHKNPEYRPHVDIDGYRYWPGAFIEWMHFNDPATWSLYAELLGFVEPREHFLLGHRKLPVHIIVPIVSKGQLESFNRQDQAKISLRGCYLFEKIDFATFLGRYGVVASPTNLLSSKMLRDKRNRWKSVEAKIEDPKDPDIPESVRDLALARIRKLDETIGEASPYPLPQLPEDPYAKSGDLIALNIPESNREPAFGRRIVDIETELAVTISDDACRPPFAFGKTRKGCWALGLLTVGGLGLVGIGFQRLLSRVDRKLRDPQREEYFSRAAELQKFSLIASEPPAEPTDHHLILVHGTFAPNTDWIQKNSRFRRMLAGCFGAAVTFHTCKWSGRNWHSSRLKAVQAIQSEIQNVSSVAPTGKCIVIGHSHGGNIALLAAKDPKIQSKLAGIVCLATPFLHIGDVLKSEFRRQFLLASGALASLTIPFIVVNRLKAWDNSAETWKQHTLVWALMGAIFLVTALCGVCSHPWRETRIGRRFRVWLDELLPKAVLPDSLSVPVLNVRMAGDEASGILVVGQFLQWALDYIWARTARVAYVLDYPGQAIRRWGLRNISSRWIRVLPAAICVLWFGVLYCAHIYDSNLIINMTLWIAVSTLALSFGGLIVKAIIGVLSLPLITLKAICMWPFGLDLAVVSLFRRVTVESTLMGQHLIHLVADQREPVLGVEPLSHCNCTDEPSVIILVSDWIRERFG